MWCLFPLFCGDYDNGDNADDDDDDDDDDDEDDDDGQAMNARITQRISMKGYKTKYSGTDQVKFVEDNL